MRLPRTLTPLSVALFVLLVAVALAGMALIPAGTNLPIHWGASGAADRFLPRDAALAILPLIALFTVGLLALAPRLTGREQAETARAAIRLIMPAVVALLLAIEIATVLIGMGHAVDMVRVVVLGLGLVLANIGFVLPGVQPNLVVGIRLPWTLGDADNWRATHRLAGPLFVGGGLAMALTALLTGNSAVLLGVAVAGILGPLIVTLLHSWPRARRP